MKRYGKILASFFAAAAIAAALLAPAVAANAAAYYVGPNGSDENAGTQESPFKTVAHAVTKSTPGDIINIAEGKYEVKNVQIDKSLKLVGAGREKTIFTADLTVDYSDMVLILGHVGEYGKDISGTSVSGIGFEYTATGQQTAAIYYTASGKTSNVVIKDCAFIGKTAQDKTQAMGIATPYSTLIGNLTISGNIFKDMKYAMYFNSLVDSSITGNTFVGTRYNGINIAADTATYPCKEITVSGNKLSEISRANYEEEAYSSGIRIGQYASDNTVTNNEIHMLNDKKPYSGFTQAAKLKTEVFYATLKEAVAAVEEGGAITLLMNNTEEFSITKTLEMLHPAEETIKATAGEGYELSAYKTKYAVSKKPVKP
ncbi:MAG: DUF1565 domain-containing protein, partial [Cloacibacillus sp.]